MDNLNEIPDGFNLSPEMLDEIQANIEEIIKGFPIAETNKLEVLKKINFMYTQTRHMSVTDALTGLYNRRYFENIFEREFLRAQRYDNNLTVAILDIDFFKKINDTHGHLCGDHILREVAYLILNALRKTDIVFRFGGEEFIIILTETSLEKAQIPLERIRQLIEEYQFYYNENVIKVSVSIGAEELHKNILTPEQLIQNADTALYTAKKQGRNQLVISSKT